MSDSDSSVVHAAEDMTEFIMLSGKSGGPSRRSVFHREGDGWIREEQVEQDGRWKTLGTVELDYIQFAGPITDA
jgi:hypothetical protein